jgi:hypothetical protein
LIKHGLKKSGPDFFPAILQGRKPVTEVQAAVTTFTVAAIESDEHTASPANPLYFPFEFVAVHAV